MFLCGTALFRLGRRGIYGNKGITLLLLDEPLMIPFEVPRGATASFEFSLSLVQTLSPSSSSGPTGEGELSQRDYTNLLTNGGLRLR